MMAFVSGFIFVLSILLFQILLVEGRLRGTGAVMAAVLVAGICCVAGVFFCVGILNGGQITAN